MGADVTPTGWTPLRAAARASRAVLPRSDKEEAFFRLALTHAQVAAGDAMVTVSLAGTIFFTTSLNGARPRLVLSLLLTMAPFAVVAPFLGPAIDRSRGGRRLMIIGSAAGRAVVCLYMATVVHSVLLYPCALVVLILSKAHAVAKSALVPATVHSPAEFVKAGGRLAIIATVAGFLGAVPAALVWKVFDASWALRLAAVAYAGAAVMAVRIRPAPPARMDPPDHVDEAVRSRGVSLAGTCMVTLRACSGFLTFAVAFVLRRAGSAAGWYGLVGAGALVGGFLGNVVGPRLRAVLAEERILTAVLAMVCGVAVIAARLDDRFGLVLLAFAMGLADGIGQLAFDAIVQRDGSEGSRGRSFARFEASFQLAWVGAALVPVVVGVPAWVACITMAAAAGASALAYAVGRHLSPRAELDAAAASVPRDDAAPAVWGVAFANAGDPDRHADVWDAVRPAARSAVVDGAAWVEDATPPMGTPVVAPGTSGGGGAPSGSAPQPEARGEGQPVSPGGVDPSPGAQPGDADGRGGPRRNPGRSRRRS